MVSSVRLRGAGSPLRRRVLGALLSASLREEMLMAEYLSLPVVEPTCPNCNAHLWADELFQSIQINPLNASSVGTRLSPKTGSSMTCQTSLEPVGLFLGRLLRSPCLYLCGRLSAKPGFLGQLGPDGRIVRRHHRIVGRLAPFRAILLGCHSELGNVTSHRFESLPILQAHNVIGKH